MRRGGDGRQAVLVGDLGDGVADRRQAIARLGDGFTNLGVDLDLGLQEFVRYQSLDALLAGLEQGLRRVAGDVPGFLVDQQVFFFDADGDGWLDLYIVNGAALPGYTGETGPNALFLNSGDGTFTDITTASGAGDEGFGMAAAVGDADNDGDADLYVANYGDNVFYRNDGDGRFSDVTAAATVQDSGWSTGATFVDIDRDGDLDLYVANYMDFRLDSPKQCYRGQAREYCGPNTYPGQSGVLFRNDGDLSFTDVTDESGLGDESYGIGIALGDFDNDGDLDVYLTNLHRDRPYRNNGDGTFTDVTESAGITKDKEIVVYCQGR